MKWYSSFRLFYKKFFSKRHTVIATFEFPECVQKDTLYIVGKKNDPWLICFVCPCGCSDVINLSLLKGDYPAWRITDFKKGNLTIRPSVLRVTKCKSHFFITKSKVDWVHNY
jgi:hypothetical protein